MQKEIAENEKATYYEGLIGFVLILIFPYFIRTLNFLTPGSYILGYLVTFATLFAILVVSKGNFKEFGFVGFRFSTFLRPMLLISIFAISTTLLNKYILKFHGVVPKPNDMLNFLLIVLIIAPISEELQFRSLLQSTLQKVNWKSFRIKNIQITFPVLCSSLVFGLIHITNIFKGASMNFAIFNAFSAFIAGLFFSYYREKTGSVLISILLHIFGNFIAFISSFLF
jgi:membrane protease YdiL (CAAX protease family)